MATTRTTQSRARSRSKKGASRSTRKSSPRPGRAQGSAAEVQVDEQKLEELVLEGLETEMGGVQVYEAAVRCATNEELREEWEKYLEETRHHVLVMQRVCEGLGIDADKETPGRAIVRLHAEAHLKAMEQAQDAGDPDLAQVVAAECVVLAEVKDHQNWQLMGELVKSMPEGDDRRAILEEAYEEVEDEEDEHLYHSMGWARELWIHGLGLPAALPPPEEEKDVRSMVDAGRAKQQRRQMASRQK